MSRTSWRLPSSVTRPVSCRRYPVLIGCKGASETHIRMRIEVLLVGVRPMLEAAARRAYWRLGRPGAPRKNRVGPPARPREIHRVPVAFERLGGRTRRAWHAADPGDGCRWVHRTPPGDLPQGTRVLGARRRR